MKQFLVKIVITLILIFCTFSCTVNHPGPKCIRDHKQYGVVEGAFRSRWWNYYERGLSYLDGQCYNSAKNDFLEAIKQRDKDERMARTYGMHFVDYFPHRELGLVYFFTGNYKKSKQELNYSIKKEPSDKARYYLDKVRKKILQKTISIINNPEIIIENDEIWTNQDPIHINGLIKDDNYVCELIINNEPVYMESSSKIYNFKKDLNLEKGTYKIPIVAKNLLGKIEQKLITIHIDRQGPTISVNSILTIKNNYKISGRLIDESGDISLKINDLNVFIPKGKNVLFNHLIPQQNCINNKIELSAHDKLGNNTNAIINLNDNNILSNYSKIMLASRDNIILTKKSDSKQNIKNPPIINLNYLNNNQTVYNEKILIDGQAADENNIELLTINNETIFDGKGKYVFFNYPILLRNGTNSIIITAKNQNGISSTKTLKIIKETPEHLKLKNRLGLTVFPIDSNIENNFKFIKSFESSLIQNLLNQKRFRIIERNKNDNILQKESLKEVSHISISGFLFETRLGIEVVIRLIDNETTQIIAVEDAYIEHNNQESIAKLIQTLSTKIHLDFPLISGNILEIQQNKIVINIGKEKIKPYRRLLIYRENVKDVKNQIKYGINSKIIGNARILDVNTSKSNARTFNCENTRIELEDRVITQ